MDHSCSEDEMETKDTETRPKLDQDLENTEFGESKSLVSTEEGENEEDVIGGRGVYLQIPYGFQSRGCYKHASKNCEIAGVTHNSRFRQFVFLDSRGITSWSYESVYSTVTRHLNYPSYQFNVLRLIIFSRKFNVYFALSKEYALKVFNLNFHEVFSVAAEMHSVLCMVFNHGKDELITGGTGGMKFWTFGEIDKDRQKAWERDSRPMANFGLVLRASYPEMGGSWVKQVELDEAMQRLYCLSERSVVVYDMEGNLLFQILDAHRGPVTGCVYSKAANFFVTVGNDCDINVWSRSKSGGRVHTFTGHSKAITNILLHPESSALVITVAMDGIVKVHSLDFMEEIYSLAVFSEGIFWMDIVSTKLLYCCSNRKIEVFSLNHLSDFWALTRCSVTSLSQVTCHGKSTRVMAIGNDSSVRLISRKRQNLSTVLPPPPISPLNMVRDVTYSRDFNMMYLLINEQEIWVYYTRTNPATRVESWTLDFIEDIHSHHSQDATVKSRGSSPWPDGGNRTPSPFVGDSHSLGPSSLSVREASGRDSLSSRRERVTIMCLGMLYSPIIMQSVEGEACPDVTQFLMAGTQDGRVLFLHMFCKGLKFHQIQANKDAVLAVHHDQVMNTLVTKCRHPGIAILIWSLPYLHLLKRIDCEPDLTCFTRMHNLLLCGHDNGYLHIHSLAEDKCERCEEIDENVSGVKRPLPKDHQDRINSVDANLTLQIFCSASQDGVVKLWDKEKTLLCEITLDETLSVATFLNSQGDILVGFKHHIFVIPRTKAYPLKEASNDFHETDLIDDEAFETESDIYEDPSVRYEGKKILPPDPINMDNYLVPFPNLQLKTSWFMEGRPPPDLEQQNLQDEEESVSLLSENLSLAPTEVYCSPSATPRSMSLASFEPLSERKGSVDLWELPEFGTSPVSSPPRTPPPEPTPPPTPPPGESEEEESEGETNATTGEKQQESDPSCVQCPDPTKKNAAKKKTSIVPSFRREGGRMGNVSIDSRALRSGGGGAGYAAPVHRRAAAQRPEPKPYKPGRIPKAVAKKLKKTREKGEVEEATKETNEEQEKTEDETKAPNEEEGDDNTAGEQEITDSSRATHLVNMPPGGGKPLIRQETSQVTWQPLRTTSGPQGQDSARSAKLEEKAAEKDAGTRGLLNTKTPQVPPNTAELNTSKAPSQGKNLSAETGDENVTAGQTGNFDGVEDENREQVRGGDGKNKLAKSYSTDSRGVPLVTYIDPDTGEIVQKPADEIPEGAEILEDFDDEEKIQGDEEIGSLPGQSLASSRRSKGSERGEKNVSFAGNEKSADFRISQRNNRRLPNVFGSGRDSPSPYSLGVVPKEAVLPVYDPNRPGDLLTRASKNELGVSPLTIFALARSRKQNVGKSDQIRSQSAKSSERSSSIKQEASELSSSRTDDFELNDDDFARLLDKMGLPAAEDGRESSASLRPPSVRKQGSTLMRWCIRALQKNERNVMFPPKPSRPSSSPSTSNSKKTKQRGSALSLKVTDPKTRPKTADTIRSSATSHEEFSMFPYERTPGFDGVSKRSKPREQKSASSVRVNTGKYLSPGEDEDMMDAYHAMRSSIGLHESDEDYMKDFTVKVPDESLNDLSPLETNDYRGDWQGKVLARARLLKQRRLERQKSATERRQALESEQKERWKNSSHFECAPESPSKSETSVEFITPPSPSPSAVRTVTPLPSQEQTQSRNLKDQDLSTDRSYRLRMNPQSAGASLTPAAKSLMNLKSSDHHVSEIAHVLPKPLPSASIPSKCSRYVLVPQPHPRQGQPQASAMEETLLLLRFPKSRVRRRHTTGIIPRPHSNPNVRLETGFEF